MSQTAHRPHRLDKDSTLGSIIAGGFATAVAMWCVAFLTHLPGMELAPAVPVIGLMLTAITGGAGAALIAPARKGWLIGLGSGLTSSCINLLILGAFLPEYTNREAASELSDLDPAVAVIVLGFLVFGAVAGLIGGLITLPVPRPPTPRHQQGLWLGRLAIVAVVAMIPLLLIGGLVTSAEAGMAVPDWPGTYEANMFLFPISEMMAQQRVFLEHTHRLFGTLVGLSILVLALSTVIAETRRWPKILAVSLFVLVSIQGILGGIRVTENNLVFATFHGVMGQVVLGAGVLLAAVLSPTFRSSTPPTLETSASRTRGLAVALWFLTVLQLTLGATFRHTGSLFALVSHILFALVVATLAAAVGFLLTKDKPQTAGDATLARTGKWLIGAVGVQVMLGVGALWVVLALDDGSTSPEAPDLATTPAVPAIETYVATAHQAVGALILALATLALTWSFRLLAPPSHVE